jgi:hypothetical protein
LAKLDERDGFLGRGPRAALPAATMAGGMNDRRFGVSAAINGDQFATVERLLLQKTAISQPKGGHLVVPIIIPW